MATSRNDNMIAGLLRERAGYEARGLDDRVAGVDEQLAHYGHKPAKDSGSAVDPDEPPAGRTAQDPGQQTADAPEKKTAAKKTAAKKTAAPPSEK